MKDWETTSSRLCHLTFHQIGALCIPLVLWIINFSLTRCMGLPIWISGKESPCQAGDSSLIPWVENIPWRRKWQVTPVFLLGESHGQRSLAAFDTWGRKRVGQHLATERQQGQQTCCMRSMYHAYSFLPPLLGSSMIYYCMREISCF